MHDELLRFSMDFFRENHISSHLIRDCRWDFVEPFDLGLRYGLGLPTVTQEQWLFHLGQLKPGILYHYTDPFCCQYTLLQLPDQRILYIGPILRGGDPETLCRTVSARLGLSAGFARQLHDYYLRLPKSEMLVGWYDSFLRTLGQQLYGSTCRTHWVNYTDLSPESAALPRQCMPPEKPVLSIQMLEDRYALENHLLDAVPARPEESH